VAAGGTLLDSLRGQRWFAGKGRELVGASVRDEIEAGGGVLRLVDVEFAEGGPERYALPEGVPLWRPLLRSLAGGARGGFQWRGALPTDSISERELGADQSNTSYVLGERALLKCYRRLRPGVHPEVELVTFLSGRFAGVPPALGSLHYVDGAQDYAIALVQELVPDAEDGWAFGGRLVEEVAAGAAIEAAWAAEVGVLTAGLHAALAELGMRSASPVDLAERRAAAERQVDEVARLVPPEHGARLRDGLEGFERAEAAALTRVHGDYHVGQILRSPSAYHVIDFEGEPTRPLEVRRALDSPLRDVASMLRSIDHVPLWVLRDRPGQHSLAVTWSGACRAAFLHAYGGQLDHRLLRALELEKAAYEFAYADAFLPEWLPIARAGLELLLSREIGE
jgi:maltokinase